MEVEEQLLFFATTNQGSTLNSSHGNSAGEMVFAQNLMKGREEEEEEIGRAHV